jgi:hypothetical protein
MFSIDSNFPLLSRGNQSLFQFQLSLHFFWKEKSKIKFLIFETNKISMNLYVVNHISSSQIKRRDSIMIKEDRRVLPNGKEEGFISTMYWNCLYRNGKRFIDLSSKFSSCILHLKEVTIDLRCSRFHLTFVGLEDFPLAYINEGKMDIDKIVVLKRKNFIKRIFLEQKMKIIEPKKLRSNIITESTWLK